MTRTIAEIINAYPPLAFTKHPELIAELEAPYEALVTALEEIARETSAPSAEIAADRFQLIAINALKAAGRMK